MWTQWSFNFRNFWGRRSLMKSIKNDETSNHAVKQEGLWKFIKGWKVLNAINATKSSHAVKTGRFGNCLSIMMNAESWKYRNNGDIGWDNATDSEQWSKVVNRIEGNRHDRCVKTAEWNSVTSFVQVAKCRCNSAEQGEGQEGQWRPEDPETRWLIWDPLAILLGFLVSLRVFFPSLSFF